MGDFDMELYLKLTGANKFVSSNSEPSINLLNNLVYRHVSTIHYQNYNLLSEKKILDMSPQALLNRVLINRKGGMCYETSELMYHVLIEMGFNVNRLAVNVLHGDPYDGSESEHNILMVSLDGKKYLVDVGFGYNSIRSPVEFSFEETEVNTVMPGEKYQLLCEKDEYQLNIWLREAWASFYRFERPLNFIDHEQTMSNYHNMILDPSEVYIRDSCIYVGIIKDNGRIGISCDYDPEKGATNFSKLTVSDGIAESTKLDFNSFRDIVEEHINIKLPANVQDGVIKFH